VHQIRSLFSGAAAKTALVSGAVSVRCLFWQVLINAGQRWADPRALQPPGDAQEHAPGEENLKKKITGLQPPANRPDTSVPLLFRRSITA
jgi:hypothetical protein